MTNLLSNRDRAADGRVQSTYKDYEKLMELVRAAALTAAGGDLDQAYGVSMRRWETARKHLDMRGPMRANGVVAATGHDWAKTLRIALAPLDTRARVAGQIAAGEGEAAPNEILTRALRGVAHRIGTAPTQHVYNQVVRQIEAERRAEFGTDLGLPTARTIELRFTTWQAALEAAGLVDAPAPQNEKVGVEHIISECIDVIGFVPPKDWFHEWARLNGWTLPRESRQWQRQCASTRAMREKEGKTWPATARTKDLGKPEVMPGKTAKPRKRRNYTQDERLASVRRYLDALPASQQPTANDYKATIISRPDLNLLSYNAIIALHKGDIQSVFQMARDWSPS